MNIAQIENNLQELIQSISTETFIYDFLLAYGLPKASISRLQKGNLNLSKVEGEISWKKKVFFKEICDIDLHDAISELASIIKHSERFIIVTDYETLLAIDTKTKENLDIELKELPKHYDFFLPLAGMEKAQHKNENPADVKAAEKMAKLFDEIKKDNPDNSPEFIHDLNVFLSRLLFCFFSEDTNIFQDGQFTNAIGSHTQVDGSDLHTYLNKLFEVLDTPERDRHNLPAYLNAFPYVNGGLFKKRIQAPNFTRRSRQAIIDSGELQWKDINPDIFGSMFQAVISVDQRGNLGQHYTSVPNIMKVIEPLFLNDLYEAYEDAKGNKKKIDQILYRLRNIKIFDPACGSGNFLIIAYKELRKLEMKIFKENGLMALSGISLSQFYGIEIDDFAHEIAQLSLWLAEHQMNTEFFREFGRTNPTLPLKEAGIIVEGNACRLNWENVCPKKVGDEIYILGNPPYLGYSLQSKEQKEDLKIAFKGYKDFKNLDYISSWFIKASNFISNSNSHFAFVSTNSICQGEQVATLWPYILNLKLNISFAFLPFKWGNNAKGNAAVICNIVGVSSHPKKSKKLYTDGLQKTVEQISPYLISGSNTIINKRTNPLSKIPIILRGSGPTDDGNLVLTTQEKDTLIKQRPEAKKFIKKYLGSFEFINRQDRYCLWIEDRESAMRIPEIENRITKVSQFRIESKKPGTRKMANIGHQFAEIRHKKSNSTIVIPRVSSERREYIPMGFIHDETVISDSAFGIYNAPIWLFSVLTSRMHMAWVKAVSGRLKSDYRYSAQLCYNTFPLPEISQSRNDEISKCVFGILEEREKYSEKTLAQLYDPGKMTVGLHEAHRQNDLAIERCYRSKPFENDEERLEYLFKLYEKMIEEEKEKGTLFEKEKKTRKTKKA